MRKIRPRTGGFRIGAAVSGAELGEHARFQQGVARRRRGGRPDRLDPGPGPRAPWAAICATPRPPPTACRRWSRPARRRRIVGPEAARATVPVEEIPAGPGKTSLAKGEIIASIFLPKRPPKIRRRLSALHSAHRDGHRGGRRRRQPDARRRRRLHARRGWRWARWRRPCCSWPRRGRGAGRHASSTRRRSDALAAAARAACRPIDDKRGTKEFRIKVAGVLARRAAAIALERARRKLMASIARNHHHQRRRRRVPLRAAADAARRAARRAAA